jgi:membrane-bound ClpP family serine protease
MKSLDCKLERVSNAMVGAILLFVGLVFAIMGFTVIPIIGLLFALAAFVAGVVFLLAPRSQSCALVTQKLRGKGPGS